ncbi:hypothetical protein ODJ79_11990 [Actinoplanes sp. KI2]|uniref:hypothetical protein n=1 Tax=Actinoplanes sp. KI2 TaxID=2983315 RepID=UPI0021D5B33B|nr:hypothetical protein [Actinoplanes sp. KI2]MCU7724438.1 hypothetical protein [Actinoplanes sp. KI2]
MDPPTEDGGLPVTPASTTDILTHGSDRPRRLSPRGLAVVIVVGLALAGGLVAARLRPAPPFRLIDLQGVYAGMVRSDGQNDAAVIDPRSVAAEAETVAPGACEPLFEASVLNRPPPGALDGVGTFWALGPAGVSLFTYRFAGPAAAGREFARLAAAYDGCRDTRVAVTGRLTATGQLAGLRRDRVQLAYVLDSGDGTKLAVHVLALSNTVSWQYRYVPVPGPYDSQTAQNVMDSLADQMRAVQRLRR